MSLPELQAAERRLAQMINRRADSDEAETRADQRERVRADDARCASLQAEYQSDYAAFGLEPLLMRSDEWSGQFERRLLKGLQRRLSRAPSSPPRTCSMKCRPARWAISGDDPRRG